MKVQIGDDIADPGICIVEINSVATGVSSFPHDKEYNPYKRIIKESFLNYVQHIPKSYGVLAIIDDAFNEETPGYAITISEEFDEPTYIVNLFNENSDNYYRTSEEFLEILVDDVWTPIRACYRYVQIKPWL